MLTKVIEWNLRYCLLDAMFDKNFLINQSFKLAGETQRLALVPVFTAPNTCDVGEQGLTARSD